jgi:hypothetical protein
LLRGTCHCCSLAHMPAGSQHCHCCWFQALITKVSIGLQPAISPQPSEPRQPTGEWRATAGRPQPPWLLACFRHRRWVAAWVVGLL